MRSAWLIGGLMALAGCATSSPPMVKVPPVADDLVGWSAPVAEEAAEVVPSIPTEPDTARSPREHVFAYAAGEVYPLKVPLGTPLRIALQPGERIHNLVGGDRSPQEQGQDTTPPWEVKEGLSGHGAMMRPQVFVAVIKAGLSTGLTITTTKRVYELDLKSVGRSPVRSVRWTYDDDVQLAQTPPRLLPDPSQPQRYHVPYTIETSQPRPPWTVRQVVDDGRKTYLIFPPTVTTIDAPLIRLIGPNGPELINARQVGSIIVVDRIIHRAELRLGSGPHAELVTVQRETPRTINCPGDPECPVWSDAQVRRAE